MQPKLEIHCPYCAAQGITMLAHVQRPVKETKEGHTRYGCGNEHYFGLPTKDVAVKLRAA